MGQWEEKLGAILNDPQAMSQIMSIAQSIGGGPGQPDQATQEPAPPPVQGPDQPTAPSQESEVKAETDAAPGLDPKVMAAGLRALSVWQDPEDDRAALLQALRPFMKEERQSKVDRAIRIVRLSKAVRAALDGLQGGGMADV